MSHLDDYTSSGDYYDSDSDISISSDVNDTKSLYVYAGISSLLSSAVNKDEGDESGVITSLACPTTSYKTDEEMPIVQDDDDEDEERDPQEQLYAAKRTPTLNKVVPLATIKPVERKVVELSAPIISTTSTTSTNTLKKNLNTRVMMKNPASQLIPMTAYSEQEIEGFVLKQNARQLSLMKKEISVSITPTKVAKTMKAREASLNAKDTFTPLTEFSEQQIEAFALKQANQFTDFAANSSLSASAAVVGKTSQAATPMEHVFTPLSHFEPHIVEAMREKQLARQSHTMATDKLMPLTSISPEKLQALRAKQSDRFNTNSLYSLKKLSSLPAMKYDALCLKQQQSDRIRTLATPITPTTTPLSHPYFKDTLSDVDIDALSLEELRDIVRECRGHHGKMPGMRVDKPVVRTTTQTLIGERLTFSAQVVKHTKSDILVRQEMRVSAARPETDEEVPDYVDMWAQTKTPILHNINSLPEDQKRAILGLIKPTEVMAPFKNQSMLSSKKEYELGLSSSIMSNPIVLSLYHNMTAKSSSLSCPHGDDIDFNRDGSISVMEHLLSHHPMYAHLLKKNLGRRLLKNLVKKDSERNVLFIVPGRALLALYRQQGALLNMTKLALAYLTVLLRKGETIPVSNAHFEAKNLLRDTPITIRRIDDETLEIDGSRIAKLDPASNGKVYVVTEPPIESLDEETAASIIETEKAAEEEKKAEEELKAEETIDAEIEEEIDAEIKAEEEQEAAELAEADEEEGGLEEPTTTIIRSTRPPVRTEPQVVRTLPAADDEALELVPLEEETPTMATTTTATTPIVIPNTTRRTIPAPIVTAPSVASKCVVLTGVFRNSLYKSRQFEVLASKMFSSSYNGAKDMANYIDHQANTNASISSNQLFLKTFNCDTLYDKYRQNATAMDADASERLTPDASFRIEHKQTLTYDMDVALQMKEFIVDTTKMKINKRQLMNHFNVLCFKTANKKDANQYATLSFTLPDETTSLADTYASSDENFLLKFKDNLLQSIAINTNSSNLLLATLREDKVDFLGQDVMQNITTKVSINSQLYDRELSYPQFMSAVLPLSQSSVFLKRLRAAREALRGDKGVISLSKLTETARQSLVNEIDSYRTHVRETTDDIRASIGVGVIAAARLNEFTLNRDVHRKPGTDQYVTKYEYEDAELPSQPQISFMKLIPVSRRAADRPVLTIELVNPLKGKKELFRFNLASIRAPTARLDKEIAYTGESGDLRFDFILTEAGNVKDIFIRYSKAARRSGLSSSLSTSSSYEQELTKFLASEAYAYQKHGLNLTSTYIGIRLDKYLQSSGLSKEKIDSLRYKQFFTSLNREIRQHMEREKLSSLLVKLPDTNLTVEKSALLLKTGYEKPRPDESKNYHSLLLTGFAALNSNTSNTTTPYSASNVVSLAIREYQQLAGLDRLVKDQSFALFMDRFLAVSAIMADAFNTK